MTQFFSLLLLGLGAGTLYALSALGLVLVFRSSGVVNFASGAMGMVGTFVFLDLTGGHGWNTALAAVAGVAVSGALGLLTHLLVMRPLREASVLTKVIATLALLLVLESAAQLQYGDDTRTTTAFLPSGTADFPGGVSVGQDRLVLLGIALLLTAVLYAVYRSTRFGLATSAVAENPRTLASLGWRVDTVRAVNWTLGAALAGLAGILLVPITGAQVVTTTLIVIPALATALVGGLSSFPLTLLGGLGIGIAQSELGVYNRGLDGLPDAAPFLVIMAVLLLRGRVLPLRTQRHVRLPRLGSGHIRPLPLVVGFAAVAALLGWASSDDWANAATTSLLFSIILLSVVAVTGFAGQLSLAQYSLAGCGALTAGRLVAHPGLPFELAILVAMLATVPAGLVVGLPSLRARGVSLGIATLAFAVAINALVFGNTWLSGGTAGITVGPQSLFGVSVDPLLYPQRYAVVVLVCFTVIAVALANLRRGRAGRRLLAVRNNERAASALGINVVGAKLWAFAYGAAIAAVGGVLTGFRNYNIQFTVFDVFSNILAVAYAVIGGVGTVLGPLVGGLLPQAGVGSTVLDNIGSSNWSKYLSIIGGSLLLLTVLTSPDGVVESVVDRLRRIRARVGDHLRERPDHRIEQEVDGARRVSAARRRVRPAQLTVHRAGVRFGGVSAVDGVSFSIAAGEVVSLIGPNGAGKTTLIDAITGFVPMTGTVELDGKRIERWPAHRRARAGIARSFQSLELFEDVSVFDNLRCASDGRDTASYLLDLVRPRRRTTISAATVAAIDTFGLASVLGRVPAALPYGQRRLVGIGRAVAGEPSVVLLDEPCAGLDEHERTEVGNLIRVLADDWGMAVLLVEHDVDLVSRVSNRIVVLDFGLVVATGPPAEALADPLVLKAYLGDLEVQAVPT